MIVITAPDSTGHAADFADCEKLKVAEGTFPGSVGVLNSTIERIGKLEIQKANKNGVAACFINCPNLKVAEGNFPGSVDFESSGIERIGELTIHNPNNQKVLDITRCEKLTRLPKKWWDITTVDSLTSNRLADLQNQRDAATTAQKTAPDLEI